MKKSTTHLLIITKSAILMLLVCGIVFSLFSCTKEEKKIVPTQAPTQAAVPTEKPTEKPTKEPLKTNEPTQAPATQAPADVPIPTPYFDLVMNQDGSLTDPHGNATFTNEGEGTVGKNTVKHKGKSYDVWSYCGDNSHQYIDALYTKFDDADDLKNMILEGITFELFFQIDTIPKQSVGIMSSGYSGGINMTLRGGVGQMNFNIGNPSGDGEYASSSYAYAQSSDASQGEYIDEEQVAHMVGTYDKEENTINLYYNGELISSADFGTPNFKLGSSIYNHLGIGVNISYITEALGTNTTYIIIRSRVYNCTLSADEVRSEYNECIRLLTDAA